MASKYTERKLASTGDGGLKRQLKKIQRKKSSIVNSAVQGAISGAKASGVGSIAKKSSGMSAKANDLKTSTAGAAAGVAKNLKKSSPIKRKIY